MSKLTMPLILLILTALVGSLLAGCGSNESKAMTTGEVRQILTDSVEATTGVDSLSFSVDAAMSMNMTDTSTGHLSLDLSGNGAADLADEEMELTLDMSFDMNMGIFNLSLTDITLESYKVGDWNYQHIIIPDSKDEWTKTPATNDGTDSLNRNLIREQLSFIGSPVEVELLPEETLNGTACYVIKFVPDAQKLADALSEQPMLTETISATDVTNLNDLLANIQTIVWIAKDSSYLMKVTLDGAIDTADLETTATAVPMMDGGMMSFNMNLSLDDFNKKVDIQLPPEAANATETSADSLFSEDFGSIFGDDMFNLEQMPQFSQLEGFDLEKLQELLKNGELDLENLPEFFQNGDLDLDKLSGLSELFNDQDLDLSELFGQFQSMIK